MGAYILRRVLQMIPLLIGITFLTFAIVNLLPSSPVSSQEFGAHTRGISQDYVNRIRDNLGLGQPWPKRYLIWLSHVARGDLGLSLKPSNRTPVRDQIMAVLPNTILLSGTALILSVLIAIPIGVYAAVRRHGLFDHFTMIGSVAAFAVPIFWLGLLLIILFAVKFRDWGLPALPVGGMQNDRNPGGLIDRIQHMILPVTSLALVQVAGWTRYIRSSMLEVIRQDYVRTAWAKGLRARVVIFSHAFRNALLPLVTLIGLSIPDLFGGAFLIEQLFAWNGLGRLAVKATQDNDYTLVMGITLMFAVLTIIGNLIADVLYAVLDPRIRYD